MNTPKGFHLQLLGHPIDAEDLEWHARDLVTKGDVEVFNDGRPVWGRYLMSTGSESPDGLDCQQVAQRITDCLVRAGVLQSKFQLTKLVTEKSNHHTRPVLVIDLGAHQ